MPVLVKPKLKAKSKKESTKKAGELIVHFILDNSGSMSAVQDATISGFNEYVATLKKDKKNKYKLALTKFADYVTTEKPIPISKVEDLTYNSYPADGVSTSLYDGVCKTLKEVEKEKGRHLVVIMTDGMENSSREYNEKDMRRMIKELEKTKNWTFTYLGANQDAYHLAQKYGINVNNTSNFNTTARGMAQAMHAHAHSTVMMASSGSSQSSAYFTPQQQKEMEETE